MNEQSNSSQSIESPSPPLVFHAIAPASSEEINNLSEQDNNEQKVYPLKAKKNRYLIKNIIFIDFKFTNS